MSSDFFLIYTFRFSTMYVIGWWLKDMQHAGSCPYHHVVPQIPHLVLFLNTGPKIKAKTIYYAVMNLALGWCWG